MQLTSVPTGSRRNIRRSVELGCELISNRSDTPFGCLATDLSTGGMWICTAKPVRAGEHVVVCFRPVCRSDHNTWGTGDLTLFAEVTRVISTRMGTPGGGMGLEFLDLDGAAKRDLDVWLGRRKMPIPRRRRPMPNQVPKIDVPRALQRPAEPAPKAASTPPTIDLRPDPPALAPMAFRPGGVWR